MTGFYVVSAHNASLTVIDRNEAMMVVTHAADLYPGPKPGEDGHYACINTDINSFLVFSQMHSLDVRRDRHLRPLATLFVHRTKINDHLSTAERSFFLFQSAFSQPRDRTARSRTGEKGSHPALPRSCGGS